MKKLFVVIAVIAILLCLSSCRNKKGEESSTPNETVSDGIHFGTVSDLLTAIKHDPYNFIDQDIQVKGTLCKFESETLLFDYRKTSVRPDGMDRYEFRTAARNTPNVCIIIPDEILYTVVESGDYITVSGTVKIADGKIYLDNCTYTLNS